MVTAFALCAELESRAFAVASERALSSVSHDGVGSLRSARQWGALLRQKRVDGERLMKETRVKKKSVFIAIS